MNKIISLLPDIYEKIFPEVFDLFIDDEINSDCNNCSMVCGNTAVDSDLFFNKKSKCCTYHPFIKNYLAGAILSDTSAENAAGRQLLIDKINNKTAVTPQGVMPSKKNLFLYKNSDAFGRNSSLICPFLLQNEGKCSIWKYRSAICSTWHCKPYYGKDGENLWNSINDFLVYTENTLSIYASHKSNIDSGKIEFPWKLTQTKNKTDLLTANDLDESISDKDYQSIWGTYHNNVIDYYIDCYEIIKNIDQKKFKAISGIYHEVLSDKIQLSYNLIYKSDVPTVLKKNPALIIEKMPNTNYSICSYNVLQKFEIPKELYDILDNFDGYSSNTEIRNNIKKTGVAIDDELLKHLYHNRILIAN